MFDWSSLKIVLIITETRRRKNEHVSEETQCSTRQMVNKGIVQNMVRGTYDIKI